jgi:hypothetical protein
MIKKQAFGRFLMKKGVFKKKLTLIRKQKKKRLEKFNLKKLYGRKRKPRNPLTHEE